jgi:hypothetical protein
MIPEDDSPLTFKMDFRGPSAVGDCLDCVYGLPLAVEMMREKEDTVELPNLFLRGTKVAFETLDRDEPEGIGLVAIAAQDTFYRSIATLPMMDEYTVTYCSLVVRYFFIELANRGARSFYILDNTLRDDRLEGVLAMFEMAGILPVCPRFDGTEWPALAARIRGGLQTCGHAAYIEPDAQVNHLDAAKALGRDCGCVATFRNLGPDDMTHDLIATGPHGTTAQN